jgi:hypothetical protein
MQPPSYGQRQSGHRWRKRQYGRLHRPAALRRWSQYRQTQGAVNQVVQRRCIR